MKWFTNSQFWGIYWFSLLATCAIITVVGMTLGSNGLFAMLTLIALEVTFSLDNAVVNAQVLERMSVFWRRMFMTLGIIIAVFGMRLLLPIILVSVAASMGFQDVIQLALNNPQEYARRLAEVHPIIAVFGGMFLLMIFLDFIFGEFNSRLLKRMMDGLRVHGAERYLEVLLAVAVLLLVCLSMPEGQRFGILLAGICGMAAFLIVRGLSDWFATAHAKHKHTSRAFVRGGAITFLYLEMLDASFSFDSVIGAFAITNNVLLIAAGLGAGAVWVRSITIDLVKNGALRRYTYLDLGAHLAIGALATVLLVGLRVDVPDLLAGGIGLLIILASFFASVVHNRRVAKSGV